MERGQQLNDGTEPAQPCPGEGCAPLRDLEAQLRQRNAELEEKNRLLTDVLENMGEGLLVTSNEGGEIADNRILLVNTAYKRLFGVTDADIAPGMRVRDYVAFLAQRSDPDGVQTRFRTLTEALKKREPVTMDIPSQGKHFHTKAVSTASGARVLVHTDVTELQHQHEALRSARDAAKVANLAKSNFLATMSHEIRTPMNGIVGMVELLAETTLDEEQSEFVETIRSSALALTSLISDILDFSKVEAGHLDIAADPFDLHGLLHEMCDLLTPLADAKQIALRCQIAPDVPQYVVGDALRLRQVLLNVVGNAIKFTSDGSVSVRVAHREDVVFTVTDTGIGIPQDRLPQIFAPFEQVHSGHSRAFEGTGLGLAISKQLVDAMNGRIAVRSHEGQGTEFQVSLPLPERDAAQDLAQPPDIPDDIWIEGMQILLVEDNQTNQMVVRKMLERRGAAVTVASNGQQAIDLYDPEAFDVVLMDISMPVLTGLEASRHIRAREHLNNWPHRPIIALTGNAFAKDQHEAMSAGMDGFLSKPVRRDALLSAVVLHMELAKKR
ncbi:ATP-binding protein [Tropicibacter naphthalenivorans]|uniref:Sensory/regulatory protein RpfC n=1 Tax=Tropicibacter naphthalenivorans TaxID=441103 RepID=A0A0P1G7M4_9RHOB|nr:ATP-binding protein [Tropicibacter naphthalenivorans]CUH77592.1 Aerobic respiration control sensor protein ArcB [Tropicibacter naphthalenivorans]SMC56220.1 Signal transduction histidine kinase [Tropicibacter naphthalenivorans]